MRVEGFEFLPRAATFGAPLSEPGLGFRVSGEGLGVSVGTFKTVQRVHRALEREREGREKERERGGGGIFF